MKNNTLVNADTDSIMFCKPDQTPFTKEEMLESIAELNKQYGEYIEFANDGYFETVIVLKAKNYILYGFNEKKGKYELKTKGSGLRDQKKPAALKALQAEIIDAMVFDKKNYVEIYMRYVKEALNVTDIKRWSTKKTITEKVLNPKRANEQKVLDAIAGSEYVSGDKCFTFFRKDESLCLVENFNGDYDEARLLEQLFKATKIFQNVLPVADYFPNFKLKKNRKMLDEML